MRLKLGVTTIAVVMCCVLFAGSSPADDTREAAVTWSIGDCSVDCHQGLPPCSEDDHVAPNGQTADRGTGGHGGCASGSCCVKHTDCYQPCDGGFLALHSAWEQNDVGTIDRLIQASDGRATLNLARQAVQVYGCDGLIMAHMPLREDVVAALDVELKRRSAGAVLGMRP
jgi:hypothetical protein